MNSLNISKAEIIRMLTVLQCNTETDILTMAQIIAQEDNENSDGLWNYYKQQCKRYR